MSAIAGTWKGLLAVIALGVGLLVASLQVAAGRSSVEPQTQVGTQTPERRFGEPMSNEIADFPQLD